VNSARVWLTYRSHKSCSALIGGFIFNAINHVKPHFIIHWFYARKQTPFSVSICRLSVCARRASYSSFFVTDGMRGQIPTEVTRCVLQLSLKVCMNSLACDLGGKKTCFKGLLLYHQVWAWLAIPSCFRISGFWRHKWGVSSTQMYGG